MGVVLCAILSFHRRKGYEWPSIEGFVFRLLFLYVVSQGSFVETVFRRFPHSSAFFPFVWFQRSVFLPESLGFRMADQSTVPLPPESQASDITESEVLWLQNHFQFSLEYEVSYRV